MYEWVEKERSRGRREQRKRRRGKGREEKDDERGELKGKDWCEREEKG